MVRYKYLYDEKNHPLKRAQTEFETEFFKDRNVIESSSKKVNTIICKLWNSVISSHEMLDHPRQFYERGTKIRYVTVSNYTDEVFRKDLALEVKSLDSNTTIVAYNYENLKQALKEVKK